MARVLPTGTARAWCHYPENDARDQRTGARWFYHSHDPSGRRGQEHGHFHLFFDLRQLADAGSPWAEPPSPKDGQARLVHIAALSISTSGLPTHWFVTNRWVTDEYIYPAHDIITRFTRFSVAEANADRLVNRFLEAMVMLHINQLGRLLMRRDQQLTKLKQAMGPAAFEQSSGHETICRSPINLERTIAQIECELA